MEAEPMPVPIPDYEAEPMPVPIPDYESEPMPEDDGWGLDPSPGAPASNNALPPGTGVPPGALYEGRIGNPEIDSLLNEMDNYLMDSGIPIEIINAEKLTYLPRRWIYAIPPRELWPNIVPTARLFLWLTYEMGAPLSARGYRPPDYNLEVKGSSRSLHQWFSAIDIRVASPNATTERRRKLAILGAELYLNNGSEFELGLGVYGSKTPSNIHIDTGMKKRFWRDSGVWLEKIANA